MAQQGAVQGYVAFLQYEGKTNQMVAYAPAQSVAGYDATFRQRNGIEPPIVQPAVINQVQDPAAP